MTQNFIIEQTCECGESILMVPTHNGGHVRLDAKRSQVWGLADCKLYPIPYEGHVMHKCKTKRQCELF